MKCTHMPHDHIETAAARSRETAGNLTDRCLVPLQLKLTRNRSGIGRLGDDARRAATVLPARWSRPHPNARYAINLFKELVKVVSAMAANSKSVNQAMRSEEARAHRAVVRSKMEMFMTMEPRTKSA